MAKAGWTNAPWPTISAWARSASNWPRRTWCWIFLGYPAGGVPPFGHRTALPVILDETILALNDRYAGLIFAGGGDDRTMMELTVAELIRVTQPTVLHVSETG